MTFAGDDVWMGVARALTRAMVRATLRSLQRSLIRLRDGWMDADCALLDEIAIAWDGSVDEVGALRLTSLRLFSLASLTRLQPGE